MVKNILDDYKSTTQCYSQSAGINSGVFFDNLIWLTTKETASYLRKTENAIHILVSRGAIRARKFRNRLYFKKDELDHLIETSQFVGGI